MGFLKSFFGAMAAAEISEKKKNAREQEKMTRDSINNVDKILNAETKFLEYLSQINCKHPDYEELISEEQIENGYTSINDVWRVQNTIDGYKHKLKEFMQLGGDPFYVYDLREMDLYIEIVRKLKEYGWLDKQEEYVKHAISTFSLDYDWRIAQKEQHKLNVQIPTILNSPGNELKNSINCSDYRFISYDNHSNSVVVDIAKSNDETIDDFLEFLTISIVFNENYIVVYNEEHDEIYYKEDVSFKNVEVIDAPISKDWSLVEVNGLSLLFNTEKAMEIKEMYEKHNTKVFDTMQHEYELAYENINSLTGVEFERVCKRILENMGFTVETTKTTGDGGIDLIAYNSQPLISGKYIIQCKRYTGSVGEPVIRDLYGVITSERANKGILMTSGTFTKQAQVFAMEKPIELIDGVKLQELLKEYY